MHTSLGGLPRPQPALRTLGSPPPRPRPIEGSPLAHSPPSRGPPGQPPPHQDLTPALIPLHPDRSHLSIKGPRCLPPTESTGRVPPSPLPHQATPPHAGTGLPPCPTVQAQCRLLQDAARPPLCPVHALGRPDPPQDRFPLCRGPLLSLPALLSRHPRHSARTHTQAAPASWECSQGCPR